MYIYFLGPILRTCFAAVGLQLFLIGGYHVAPSRFSLLVVVCEDSYQPNV